MNISDLTKRLAEAGASAPVMAIAIEVYEYFRTIPDNSGQPSEYELKIYRRVDAWRRAKSRKKSSKINGNAEANDAANAADFSVPEMSGNVIPLPLTKKNQEGIHGKEERKKSSENTRARGTRLPEDWQPSETDRKFAVANGIDPDWLRDEFVDFWTNVPGARGLKLNWSKTWNTRVRALTGSKKPFIGGHNGSGSNRKDEFRAVLDQAREFGNRGDPGPVEIS